MPRCFMAKKLKYPYEQWKESQERGEAPSPIIDVVKTETTDLPEDDDELLSEKSYEVSESSCCRESEGHDSSSNNSLEVPSYVSRGSTLITPPPEGGHSVKKDLFRPYCLQDPILAKYERPVYDTFFPYTSSPSSVHSSLLQYRNIEDINTAHAILDLSSSARSPKHPLSTPTPLLSPASSTGETVKTEGSPNSSDSVFQVNNGKTTAYTYEAFFASDGRSRKKSQVVNKPRYSCSECGKHYATSSNLSRHKQTHRSLDSNNAKKCHVCGKLYVSMPALSMHILTHNLSHKCDVCGKAFSRPWLLQGHMRSHSGDKPYGCAHCGKSFADRSNLRAHMQTHSAYKNFKCKRCNKSFALKSYLNKHYESACFKDGSSSSSEEDPIMPSSAFQPSNKMHVEEHHREEPLLTVLSPPNYNHHAPIVNPPQQHHLLRV